MDFRVGHGYDVHRFKDGRALIIGGVHVDHPSGLDGHSDADVLIHAIMDALLGAAGLGDIGMHFPDTDGAYLGISSIELLGRVKALITEKGYQISNIDATVVMQKPKISEYKSLMRANIANALSITEDRVNVKATTEERLGFTGSGEGASAHAVALIFK